MSNNFCNSPSICNGLYSIEGSSSIGGVKVNKLLFSPRFVGEDPFFDIKLVEGVISYHNMANASYSDLMQ